MNFNCNERDLIEKLHIENAGKFNFSLLCINEKLADAYANKSFSKFVVAYTRLAYLKC